MPAPEKPAVDAWSTEWRSELERSLNEYLDGDKFAEAVRPKLTEVTDQIVDGVIEELRDNAAAYLTESLRDRVNEVIAAIVAGDERALRGNVLCFSSYGPNSRARVALGGDVTASWGAEIRREIVEAHSDLIRNERISDLEAEVALLRGLLHQQRGDSD